MHKHKGFTRRRKVITAGIVAGLVLTMGGAAWAAWVGEATGSTTSTDTTGQPASVGVVVVAQAENDALLPGGSVGNVPIRITDPSTASGPANVSAVTVAVTGTSNSGCTAASFTTTNPPSFTDNSGNLLGSYPYVVAPGTTIYDTGMGNTMATVGLNASAPTACEGVTVNLLVTVS